MSKLVLILLLIITTSQAMAFGQSEIDSLKQIVSGPSKLQSSKALSNLAWIYSEIDLDSSLLFGSQALDIGIELEHPRSMMNAKLAIANAHDNIGESELALRTLYETVELAKNHNNDTILCRAYNNIGNCYRYESKPEDALKFYTDAIDIYYRIGDTLEAGKTLLNVGIVYMKLKDVKEAIKYEKKSLKICQAYGDLKSVSNAYNSLGISYYEIGKLDRTINYMNKAKDIDLQIGDSMSYAISMSNIAEVYQELGKYNTAATNFRNALTLAKHTKADRLVRHIYRAAAQNFADAEQWDSAYAYRIHYTNLDNKLESIEKDRLVANMNAKYESAEKERKIEALNKESILKELEITKKGQMNYIFGGGALAVVIALVFLVLRFLSNKKAALILQEQKDQLAAKNKEVTDSINYAKKIQSAVLKPQEHVSEDLPPHFILFKPKDIVSGDFYWTAQVDNYLYIAVADCTGHGVPGAFMSLLGMAFLNEIQQGKLLSPGAILDELRNRIIKELAQDMNSESKDGMDMSMIRISLDNRNVEWAGANNPLYIISESFDDPINKKMTLDNSSLFEVKGSKQPVGVYYNMKPFETHEIELQPGDQVYLFTDGYADQFGGRKGKKYKYKNFKQLLLNNATLPLEEQKRRLDKELVAWQMDLEQVDDICVIGVKL